MDDRELLELAAKAAGMTGTFQIHQDPSSVFYGKPVLSIGNYEYWNPIEDDGDALRLAVKLGISIDPAIEGSTACVSADKKHARIERCHRRAIVRVAAEIGKTK
jgi:hypothetical protein